MFHLENDRLLEVSNFLTHIYVILLDILYYTYISPKGHSL